MKRLDSFMKGVNLGGWLSQGSLDINHIATFIVEDDIKRISEIGCDHLRLPVDYENIDKDGEIVEYGFDYIEKCIKWCQKYGLNVVLDLHKTPGYVFDDLENSKGFFGNPILEARFLTIWDRLSSRFSKYSDMMMFEMLNEVTDESYLDSWNDLGNRCIKVIRKNAPKVKILFGGVNYSSVSSVKFIPKPADENIVYNVHCYEPLIFTHQGAYWVDKMPPDFRIEYPFKGEQYLDLIEKVPACKCGPFKDNPKELIASLGKEFFMNIFKEAVEYAEKNNVPLYCGEYGVIDLADPISTLRWLKDINSCFKEYGIGRAIWNYKEMDFGIIGPHYLPIYDELIKFL